MKTSATGAAGASSTSGTGAAARGWAPSRSAAPRHRRAFRGGVTGLGVTPSAAARATSGWAGAAEQRRARAAARRPAAAGRAPRRDAVGRTNASGNHPAHETSRLSTPRDAGDRRPTDADGPRPRKKANRAAPRFGLAAAPRARTRPRARRRVPCLPVGPAAARPAAERAPRVAPARARRGGRVPRRRARRGRPVPARRARADRRRRHFTLSPARGSRAPRGRRRRRGRRGRRRAPARAPMLTAAREPRACCARPERAARVDALAAAAPRARVHGVDATAPDAAALAAARPSTSCAGTSCAPFATGRRPSRREPGAAPRRRERARRRAAAAAARPARGPRVRDAQDDRAFSWWTCPRSRPRRAARARRRVRQVSVRGPHEPQGSTAAGATTPRRRPAARAHAAAPAPAPTTAAPPSATAPESARRRLGRRGRAARGCRAEPFPMRGATRHGGKSLGIKRGLLPRGRPLLWRLPSARRPYHLERWRVEAGSMPVGTAQHRVAVRAHAREHRLLHVLHRPLRDVPRARGQRERVRRASRREEKGRGHARPPVPPARSSSANAAAHERSAVCCSAPSRNARSSAGRGTLLIQRMTPSSRRASREEDARSTAARCAGACARSPWARRAARASRPHHRVRAERLRATAAARLGARRAPGRRSTARAAPSSSTARRRAVMDVWSRQPRHDAVGAARREELGEHEFLRDRRRSNGGAAPNETTACMIGSRPAALPRPRSASAHVFSATASSLGGAPSRPTAASRATWAKRAPRARHAAARRAKSSSPPRAPARPAAGAARRRGRPACRP